MGVAVEVADLLNLPEGVGQGRGRQRGPAGNGETRAQEPDVELPGRLVVPQRAGFLGATAPDVKNLGGPVDYCTVVGGGALSPSAVTDMNWRIIPQ